MKQMPTISTGLQLDTHNVDQRELITNKIPILRALSIKQIRENLRNNDLILDLETEQGNLNIRIGYPKIDEPEPETKFSFIGFGSFDPTATAKSYEVILSSEQSDLPSTGTATSLSMIL